MFLSSREELLVLGLSVGLSAGRSVGRSVGLSVRQKNVKKIYSLKMTFLSKS